MSDSQQEETFLSHLIELRTRLIRSVIAFVVVFGLLMAWPGAARIYDLLAQPMMHALPQGTRMIATGVVAPFFVPLKVTAMVAFVMSLPFILFQVWSFVAPGLYQHEKRFGLPLVIGSTLLFVAGMAFCYFFVFGTVFHFIATFAPKSITPAPDIEQYLAFVMTMFLAFGVTFEVPVVVIMLARFGLVSVAKLAEARPYVIVAAFIVAAVVTPPDVVSQCMLAIPMVLLYELGLLLARFALKPAAPETSSSLSEAEMERELDRVDTER